MVSGTSKETEIKLLGVSRGSLEELLVDYSDFLRVRGFPLWAKDDPRAVEIRRRGHRTHTTYETYRTYIEHGDAETAANTIVCLIHQANFLLDQQIRAIERAFVREGGLRERMTRARLAERSRRDG